MIPAGAQQAAETMLAHLEDVQVGGDVLIGGTIRQAPKVSPAWIWATLLALAVFAAAAGAALYYLSTPMQGGYNMAVAKFSAVEAGGGAVPDEHVTTISRHFFDVIEEEAGRLPAILRPETRGPGRIPAVRGVDDAARQAAAQRLAQRLNATILIFGQVRSLPDGAYEVQPEYTVESAGFFFGSEITGPSRLGGPIRVETPIESGSLALNQELAARTQALQRLVGGLGAYSVGDFDEAILRFRQAVNIPDWRIEDGQETAYFLLGQAYLRGYDRLTGDDAQLKAAYEAFDAAYQINPEYARASLGLGAVALQWAGILNAPGTGIEHVDRARLDEARYWLRIGPQQADAPPGAHVQPKADFGMGQVHLLGLVGGLPGYSATEAQAKFESVIAAYQAEPNDDLLWYAAHSHAMLGYLAQRVSQDWGELDRQARQAIVMLEDLPQSKPVLAWIARYWAWVGSAQTNLNDRVKSAQAFDNALRIGANTVNAGELELWRAQRGGG